MKKKLILLWLGCTQPLLALQFNTDNHSIMQDNILTYIKKFLPASPVILEAGGDNGDDTIRMKTAWPDATMHVFEPLPWSFQTIVKKTNHLPNINCYQYALTDFSGETDFHVDIPNNGSSSIGAPLSFNKGEFDPKPLKVACITLDEWAEQNNVNQIDFMWLDMESHELYALKKGTKILDTVKVIFTEVAYEPVREGSCLYPDLKKFLEEHGFVEVWKWQVARFGDALFIKNDLLQ